MAILSDAYTPELELFGDKFEIKTEQYPFYTDNQTMRSITPNWLALDSVVGASPKSKSHYIEKEKILKLISAIVLTSVNINDSTLTEDAKSLIEKVVCSIYPTKTIKFEMSHHWGILNWMVRGIFNDKNITLFNIRICAPRAPRVPPFARNKGNKDTCMRKVQRLREL